MNEQEENFIKNQASQFFDKSIVLDTWQGSIDDQISLFQKKLYKFQEQSHQILFSNEVISCIEKELEEHRNKAHGGQRGNKCKYEDTAESLIFYIRQGIPKLKEELSTQLHLPKVFSIPSKDIDDAKVAVIFPFELTKTYDCIKNVCNSLNISCVKANDIPNNNAFMQNVFEMIYTSKIAVCDFTKGNNNVLYETGIAHALGREVIAITQSMEDVPSDLKHINMIVYSNTEEGYQHLKNELEKRFFNL